MSERHGKQPVTSLRLPPPELRIFKLGEDEPWPTPVNKHGLVEPDELITIVKATVDPSYRWESSPGEEQNEHHLFWPESSYPMRAEEATNPHEFRNLAINKIIIPWGFHIWLHLVTQAPARPSEEIMHYYIEARRTFLELSYKTNQRRRLMRRNLSDAELRERLAKNSEEISILLEEARAIPEEFQLFDLSPYTVHDIPAIGQKLGELALKQTTNRVSDVLMPMAA